MYRRAPFGLTRLRKLTSRIVDDTLLLLLNAHYEAVPFVLRLTGRSNAGSWFGTEDSPANGNLRRRLKTIRT